MFVDFEFDVTQSDDEQWEPEDDEENDQDDVQLDSLFDLLHEDVSGGDGLSMGLTENGQGEKRLVVSTFRRDFFQNLVNIPNGDHQRKDRNDDPHQRQNVAANVSDDEIAVLSQLVVIGFRLSANHRDS